MELHGVLRKIISDWGAKFTSNFWKELLVGFETKLDITCHTQVDGQTERVNRVLEDKLRM